MNSNENTPIRDLIDMYLDNALPDEQQSSFFSKVSTDPSYHEVLETEKSFRNCIKSNFKRSSVSPELIQTIRESIRVV